MAYSKELVNRIALYQLAKRKFVLAYCDEQVNPFQDYFNKLAIYDLHHVIVNLAEIMGVPLGRKV